MATTTGAQTSLLTAFAAALDLFKSRQWTSAKSAFRRLTQHLGPDGPSEFYITLCEEYAAAEPEADWDGILRMPHK